MKRLSSAEDLAAHLTRIFHESPGEGGTVMRDGYCGLLALGVVKK